MKNDKSIRLYPLLKKYLTWPVLCLWFLSMSLLTWAVGKDFYNQLVAGSQNWSAYCAQEDTYKLPGELRYEVMNKLSMSYYFHRCDSLLPIVLPQIPSSMSNRDWIWGKWALAYGFQGAFGFYDRGKLEPILTSDGTYLIFSYSYDRMQERQGWAYIDINDLPDGEQLADLIPDSPGWSFSLLAADELALVGQLEGERFYPQKISSLEFPYSTYYASEAPMEDTVTLFCSPSASDLRGHKFDPGPGFFWKGTWYDDPAELLDWPYREGNIRGGYGFFSSLILATGVNDDYVARGVIHCSPFLYAVTRLWPVYLVTGLALIICLAVIRKKLREKLIEPFEVIDEAFRNNRSELSDFAWSPITELQRLADHFHTAQQERHRAVAEVKQLQTALDYAKEAEEKRRSMVSAIAHELKTPLAVIHSYAEGLQEGIAPEKQAQYLSVMQQETETMDAMVLQMLELSRMEAGKVRLQPEQFSLSGLTASIVEKLGQTTDRELELNAPQDILVTADKARITQVITNLVTNAIKYAQGEGAIRIKIYRRSMSAYFFIENPHPPLPQETLDKVFDSFFRADTARDRSGTGLGLAIVKSIITLHRGECQAKNTKTGVEFSFQLPL